jgi:hypothetical protein
MLVADGRKQLILYGTAEGITDTAARNEGTRRIRARAGRPVQISDEALTAELDAAHRVILRLVPDRAFMND